MNGPDGLCPLRGVHWWRKDPRRQDGRDDRYGLGDW
jgi:hypothetical protein